MTCETSANASGAKLLLLDTENFVSHRQLGMAALGFPEKERTRLASLTGRSSISYNNGSGFGILGRPSSTVTTIGAL